MDNLQTEVIENDSNDALLADLLGDTVPPALGGDEIQVDDDGGDSDDGLESTTVEAAESVAEAPAAEAIDTPAVETVQVEVAAEAAPVESAGVEVVAIETPDGVEVIATQPAADLDEAIVETAIAQVEAKEQRQEAYAEQPSAPIAATEAEAKKGKKAKEKKEKVEKKASNPRPQAGAKCVERVRHVLGAQFDNMFVLDASEVNDLPAAVAANTIAINDAAIKVGEKVVQLFGSVQKGTVDNKVMQIAFKLLKSEGQLTSGDKGNLQRDLLAAGLRIGTVRSQANQIFQLFPLLKITKRDKNVMRPNPDSTIWTMVQGFAGI